MNNNADNINKRITAILQSTLEGFWIVNNTADIIEVNDTYLKMIGYSREEFVNIKIFDVEAIENSSDTEEHIKKIIHSGSDIFETKHRKKDGTIIIVEISVSYINQDGGLFFCFLKDITKIRKTESLLKARVELSNLSQYSSLDTLIQMALDRAELLTESSIGFFHFVNEDQESLKLQTWSTNTIQNMCKAEGKGQHYPISLAGIWVECIKERKAIIHNDYSSQKNKKGLPEGHAPIIRELTVPIIKNNNVIGIIGVGNKATPYVDDDIEALSVLSSMTFDLIERKRIEEELVTTNKELEDRINERTESLNVTNIQLKKSLDKLQSLADLNQIIIASSPLGKIVYRLNDGKCVLVNNSAVEMFEIASEIFLSKTISEFELWNQSYFYDAYLNSIKIITKNNQKFSFKINDTIKWFEASFTNFKWDNENHVLLCFENISLRKQIEDILVESEEKFRSLFENITEGVALHEVIYDANNKPIDYKIIDVNPSFTGHTGLEKSFSINKKATELYGMEVPPYVNEYATVAETRQPFKFETYFSPMEKHFTISVISPQKGKFATVFEDITESKKREQEIIQKNEELTRFIYTVSHDLKSPLVTIKAFTSYLQEDIIKNDIEAQKTDLGYIKNAADKMGRLLDELLELSRVGRKENSKTTETLQNIVQEAINLVAGRINENNVSVKIENPNVILTVDKQRLIQLYQNLIDNASKYIGNQSKPQILIGAIQPEDNNSDIILYVKDNGNGIDPRYHHKIFGLFEKIDTTQEGTGIGLALVKRIVEVHNGRIWFESEGIGKGTTFYFTLDKTKWQ